MSRSHHRRDGADGLVVWPVQEPEPPESSEGLVSWVQCDNTWFHIVCAGWDEELDEDDDFKCNVCPDI